MVLNDELLNEVEEFIETGKIQSAIKALSKITVQDVPEKSILRLNDLLLRTGRLKASLRLLSFHLKTSSVHLRPKLQARYALSLMQIGAHHEGRRIFSKLNFSEVPEANLYFAMGLGLNWQFSEAIPYLEKYLQRPDLTEQQRVVGETNLAQALVATSQYERGQDLVSRLVPIARKENLFTILAQLFDLQAQIFFAHKHYDKCFAFLSNAKEIFGSEYSKHSLSIEIARCLCSYALDPRSEVAKAELARLRQRAVDLERSALVREIDFQCAIIEKNMGLYLRVYFGAPSASYRMRLKSYFGADVSVPSSYGLNPTKHPAPPNHCIDAVEGRDLRSGAVLKKGQLSHRLLQILVSDFYMSFKHEALASHLMPQEHYDPDTTMKRVSKAITRLQQWFRVHNIPLEIRRGRTGFRLHFAEPYEVRVGISDETQLAFTATSGIEKLLTVRSYSVRELSMALNIPLRSTHRRVQDLLDNARIVSQKIGREVKYRLRD